MRDWLNDLGVKAFFIEQGSPLENKYIEQFKGTLINELLKRETFRTLTKAKILKDID